MLHRETVPQHTLALLERLSPILKDDGFYLAGGTALSLRLGHRISVDLDFFKAGEFSIPELIEKVKTISEEIKIVNNSQSSLALEVDHTLVEFLRYDYVHLSGPEMIDGIYLSSMIDNSLMKLSAIVGRGAKKDFADLAKIIEVISLDELIDKFGMKYPESDTFMLLKSLTYFDDAESDPEPHFLDESDWGSIKEQLLKAVKEIG